MAKPTGLYEVVPRKGDPTKASLRWHFHRGQRRAWRSDRRFILVLAGTQGGKTSFGPAWLWREIQRRGPGDYLVVTPTYPLLTKKALPEFLRLFKRYLRAGEYNSQQKVFTLNSAGEELAFGRGDQPDPTQIFFGHASDPDSLESATAKAVWMDEAGQKKFRLGSWEAIQRRLSIHQGRALITTTPYDLGWLKQQIFDLWQAGDTTFDVVRFDSTENPAFPAEEFERVRSTLPRWKFDLFYRAIFTRPAGMIYDVFEDAIHRVPRFAIPDHWPRHLGLDFGGVNTAGVFLAEEMAEHCHGPQPRFAPPSRAGDWRPTGRFFLYREYKAGSRTAREHKDALVAGEPRTPSCVGGSKSEDQWRNEFAAAGLPIRAPLITEVEVGIDRVYGAFKRGELFVFSDCKGVLDEIGSYSRVLDEAGNPTKEIEDKAAYHYLDALRYIGGWLKGERRRLNMGV